MHPKKAQAASGWCSANEGLNSQRQQKDEVSWRLLTYVYFLLQPRMGRTPSLTSSSLWHPGLWIHMPRISQGVDEQGRTVLRQAKRIWVRHPENNGEFSTARCQTPFEVSITSFGIDFSLKISLLLPSQEPGFLLTGCVAWEFRGCAVKNFHILGFGFLETGPPLLPK